MKKTRTFLGALVALCLLCAACGKEPQPETPAPTIAQGVVDEAGIHFHDSLDHGGFWEFQPATANLSAYVRLTCEKGRLMYHGGHAVLANSSKVIVPVKADEEVGPVAFTPNASAFWCCDETSPWDNGQHTSDLPIGTMTDGTVFYVGLAQFGAYGDESTTHYGWAKGRYKRTTGNEATVEWLECCYETRPGSPIKAGAK